MKLSIIVLLCLLVVGCEKDKEWQQAQREPREPSESRSDLLDKFSDYGNTSKIRVLELKGVCVYSIDSYSHGGIAVISKASLPMGAGCQ